MERSQLSYKNSQISYLCLGTGQKKAICFHGYGEEAGSFAFLEKYAGDHYTFYAIDLPFHGQTEWKDGLNFSVEDLQQIIKEILPASNFQYTLIGFSLGGRLALSLYEKIPCEINKIILLAPDGLKVNFWYWLSTQTWIGNQLFSFTMKHPGWFFGFLKVLNKTGFVNASIFKFVNYYIEDKKARWLLYARWTAFRKIKPGLDKIKSLIRKNKTHVRLIYGMHDRIILPARGNKFMKGIEEHCMLSVIHSGHQVLHEKHVKDILPALLH